ncbi:MAG: hypothetical protein M3N19_02360 [Candidatus Eremiobacteraeota bacterium]|nr:hypothetical protein [Candidatus Eremiobacteraeota bacterium]
MNRNSTIIASLLSFALATSLGAPSTAAKPHRIAGGANQKASVEGCMNQWLFNGVWRLKVTSVDSIMDGSWQGYGVNIQLRNGTSKTIELGNSGVQGRGVGVQLITDDGNALTLNELDYQRLGYRDIVQGGGATYQVKYHFPSGASTAVKPAKFILQIDPHTSSTAQYSMHDPSFRVNLGCTK